MRNFLVKMIGFNATLIHGDTLVLDRWLWLKDRLPISNGTETLLDVGCGSGAFSLGAAKRGYITTGLSWDDNNQKAAQERAEILKIDNADFPICDARKLDEQKNLINKFDVVINFENIEHILDDKKLMIDIANCLKPGGRLLLTTPYFHFIPITKDDIGPGNKVEDGGHVVRGYSKQMLFELCEKSGLKVEDISFCSGFFSQKTTAILRKLSRINHLVAWTMILPIRPLIPLLDRIVPYRRYSICMEAFKPRY